MKDNGVAKFDYEAEAELFSLQRRGSWRQPASYKRFTTAAEAILYAIEDLAPQHLVGACLEIDEIRFDSTAIRDLYASTDFPLRRRGPENLPAAPSKGGRPPVVPKARRLPLDERRMMPGDDRTSERKT